MKTPDDWWVVVRRNTNEVLACEEFGVSALANARQVLGIEAPSLVGARIMKVKDARKEGVTI